MTQEEAYERINVLEDLLGCALAHLDGDPCYANRETIRAYLQAYFDARKARRPIISDRRLERTENAHDEHHERAVDLEREKSP